MAPPRTTPAPVGQQASADQTEVDPTEGDDEFIASVGLMIKHPTQSLLDLTNRLKLDPHRTWTVGTKRSTPTGTKLPGLWQDSYWGASDEVTHENAEEMIEHYIGQLMAARDRIKELTSGGGWVCLSIHMHGKFNFGFLLSAKHIAQLAELGAEVSAETFPRVNRH